MDFLLGCRHCGIELLTALLREHDAIAWCQDRSRFLKQVSLNQNPSTLD